MQRLHVGYRWIKASRDSLRVASGWAALAGLLSCASLDASLPAAHDHASFIQGVEALEQEASAQAIQHFDAALGQDDADAYAYVGLSLAHIQRNQHEEAFNHYWQAIRLLPESAQALIYIS